MVAVSQMKRFLACRRAAVALEGAIGIFFLTLTLAGVFDIIHAVFVRDLLQRAANSVALANALSYAAADETALQTRIEATIKKELGGLLDFELQESCTPSTGSGQAPTTAPDTDTTAAYCLTVEIAVYDTPQEMHDGTRSGKVNAELGGDPRDMVVVHLQLLPQTRLSPVKRTLFGEAGLRTVAIVRNEGTQGDAV